MQSPVAIYYGDNDLLADLSDIKKILQELPHIVNMPWDMVHEVNYVNWNHMDFLWGMDANSSVYVDMIKNLNWCESAAC